MSKRLTVCLMHSYAAKHRVVIILEFAVALRGNLKSMLLLLNACTQASESVDSLGPPDLRPR